MAGRGEHPIDAPRTQSRLVARERAIHRRRAVSHRGIQLLIPPDAGKPKGAPPGWDGGAYAHMRRVLSSEHGGGPYRKRQGMIEPVFAQTKFNRRIDRFQCRGRSAARSEWRLITATPNLLKLHRRIAAAGA